MQNIYYFYYNAENLFAKYVFTFFQSLPPILLLLLLLLMSFVDGIAARLTKLSRMSQHIMLEMGLKIIYYLFRIERILLMVAK